MLGLTSREQTPVFTERLTYAAAETRSFRRAEVVMQRVGGNLVSFKTIQRVTQDIGQELVALRDATGDEAKSGLVHVPEAPPQLAVVQCDGGRIRTRQPGHGPGVHEEAWRETKNACLLRMSHQTFAEDPHPELPKAFRDPQHVAKIAEKEAPCAAEVAEALCASVSEEAEASDEPADWRPKRLVRTCLSSMARSEEFGRQMARETEQRRFDEAPCRAFLGDGLPWNWSIWRAHYFSYVPILDFVHVLSYLYAAAMSQTTDYASGWAHYLGLATRCWQGRAAEVSAELAAWLAAQGTVATQALDDHDPRKPVQDAWRYLTNNQQRMDYPRYRQQGMPVTTALMESLVKEINYRVKGTEMFWNDPAGAESILQVKAAALCDDDRLADYLSRRPGQHFVRRQAPAIAG
jgi:hypothetical protein